MGGGCNQGCSVGMNLPGDDDNNTSMPWVYKWDKQNKQNKQNKRLASHFSCYINNICSMSATEKGLSHGNKTGGFLD